MYAISFCGSFGSPNGDWWRAKEEERWVLAPEVTQSFQINAYGPGVFQNFVNIRLLGSRPEAEVFQAVVDVFNSLRESGCCEIDVAQGRLS